VTDHIEEFLSGLAAKPPVELRGITATLRIDVEEPDQVQHWLLAIADGTIAISARSGRADAVMTSSSALFNRLFKGEVNALTATLRGDLRIDGDLRLLLTFKRLLPGPPNRRTVVETIRPSRAPARKTTAAARKSTASARKTTVTARTAKPGSRAGQAARTRRKEPAR
jgi:predicted lipid carrier protein YhbT